MKAVERLLTGLKEPLIYLMGGLFAISIALFVFLYQQKPDPDTLDIEVAKVALQVGVVAVAGALLSLLVSNREQRMEEMQAGREEAAAAHLRKKDQEREDRRYREDLLKATMNRITSSYNHAKRARRNMRALGLDRSKEPVLVDVKRWDECMVCVNDAQLEFETVIADLEANPKAYPSAADYKQKLKDMEEYLGELIREYEKLRSRAGPHATEIPLAGLEKLSDFLGEVTESLFKSEFSGAHGDARKAIRKDLKELTSSLAS